MNFKFYQLYRSLKEVVGIEKAKIIFPEYDSLPDKMTKVEQINMARILMKRLDDEFEEDVVLDIRMKHPCGIPKDIKEQIIKIKSDLGNKDDRIEALMKYLKGSFNKLSVNDYQITWGLKECVCGMFRNQKDYEVISPTWCQCCNGHNKIIFEELLDQELQSQLIEGICAGESVCSFKIKI